MLMRKVGTDITADERSQLPTIRTIVSISSIKDSGITVRLSVASAYFNLPDACRRLAVMRFGATG